jgi:DNA-directed RNA polymerase subunit RPC12/RpoP
MTELFIYPCLNCSSIESPTIDIKDGNFLVNGDTVNLIDCYKYVTGIKIESTAVNMKICQLCQLQLQRAYTFKQKFSSTIKDEVKEEPSPVYEESIYVCTIQDDPSAETIPNTSSNPDLQCPICLQLLTSQSALEHHIKIHNPRHLLYCRFCETEMPDKTTLVQHHQQFHLFYECVVCGQQFQSDEKMNQHQTKEHIVGSEQDQLSELMDEPAVSSDGNGKKSVLYTCVICDKKYTTLRNLINHEKFMHNPNLEKLSCPFCQRKIKYEQHLKKHIRIFHPEEVKNYVAIRRKSPIPIDEYKCVVCGDTFGLISLLHLHQRESHTVTIHFLMEGKSNFSFGFTIFM